MKKIAWYLLRKLNIRQKIRILNSRIVPKNLKRDPLGFFNSHSVAKYQKNEEALLRHMKIFGKSLTMPKKVGKSHSTEKSANGGPFCFGMVLYFMLEALDALKIKTEYLLKKCK